MKREDIEQTYKDQGLETDHFIDEPGKVYDSHGHEKTHLLTLAGAAAIKVEDRPYKIVQPGEEFIVGSGQVHKAVVGPAGWEAIAAWDPAEAAEYPHEAE